MLEVIPPWSSANRWSHPSTLSSIAILTRCSLELFTIFLASHNFFSLMQFKLSVYLDFFAFLLLKWKLFIGASRKLAFLNSLILHFIWVFMKVWKSGSNYDRYPELRSFLKDKQFKNLAFEGIWLVGPFSSSYSFPFKIIPWTFRDLLSRIFYSIIRSFPISSLEDIECFFVFDTGLQGWIFLISSAFSSWVYLPILKISLIFRFLSICS